MNLLRETEFVLEENGKTLKDIVAVQGRTMGISVKKFLKLADIDYDDGFGPIGIAEDLLVIGKDWWLERHNYEGAEWWEYKEYPKILPVNKNVYAIAFEQSGYDWPMLNCLSYYNSGGLND